MTDNNIVLLFLVPVKLTHVSGDQTVREGRNTILFCEGTGKPTPKITLTRVLKDGSDGETWPQSLTYNFPNINRSASGTYRCKAENEYETVSQVFEVIVICKYVVCKYVSLCICPEYKDHFMESARVRYLRTFVFSHQKNELVNIANERVF